MSNKKLEQKRLNRGSSNQSGVLSTSNGPSPDDIKKKKNTPNSDTPSAREYIIRQGDPKRTE